jgi:putative transposase
MNYHGNNFDNLMVESFGSSLKNVRIQKRIYKIRDLARADAFDSIKNFHNQPQRHSHLHSVSPEASEGASTEA